MRRKQPGGADDVARTGAHTVAGLNLPPLLSFVVADSRNACVALDVAFEIEFVRHKMQIPFDFRLGREMLAPIPLV